MDKYYTNVNDENFEQEVLASDIPVLVDFWAEWCGPCRMIAPMIEEIAKEYEGKVKVCKLDVDSAPLSATKYEVMNIPTIIVFKEGDLVDKVVGAVAKSNLVSKLNEHL